MDGTVTYWDGKPGRGPALRVAEQAIIKGAGEHGLRDVFWKHRGHGVEAFSHRVAGTERRYDHVFASGHFATCDSGYYVEWMDGSMSDHAVVWAKMEWAPHRARW